MNRFRDRVFDMLPDTVRVVVEIGTDRGDFALRALYHIPGDNWTLYCVDSWEGHYEPHHAIWKKRLAEHLQTGRVVAVHGRSLSFAPDYPRLAADLGHAPEIDVLYIDGDHTQVEEDLRAWVPLVREGGLVVGHDAAGNWWAQYVSAALKRCFPNGGYEIGRFIGTPTRTGGTQSFLFYKDRPYGQLDSRMC